MCRLFGFRSAVVSRAHRSLIEAGNALRHQARDHADGWGIGWFLGREAYLLKSQEGAHVDDGFRRAADRLASHTMVVHVRKATVGRVHPRNVHPFRSGRWVFAHNGTIHSFDRVGPRMRAQMPRELRERVLGETDTETLFHWLLGRFAESGLCPRGVEECDVERLGGVLASAVAELARLAAEEGAAPPAVNFILTDGQVFVAHRRGRELFLATQKQTCHDAPTCPAEKICLLGARPLDEAGRARVNHLIVASERIGDEDAWEEVPDGHLLVLGADFRLRMGATERWAAGEVR